VTVSCRKNPANFGESRLSNPLGRAVASKFIAEEKSRRVVHAHSAQVISSFT
jgi:hypothetical protein